MKKVPLITSMVLGIILAAMAVSQAHHPMESNSGSNPAAAPATADQPAGTPGEEQMNAATHMMHSHHMESGPHMKMTEMRAVQSGDQERANEIIANARHAMERYKDYHAALSDGYQIFLPNLPQPQYHFTNYWYGFEAAFRFNPDHPTSLLYEKTKDGGYNLIGVMYTAPENAPQAELDRRIPLSVAQWHLHVNFCFPPKERQAEMFQPNPRFGMAGSITTKDACDQAGGKFVPHLFGWMIHLYPFEKDPADIWAMGSKHDDSMDHDHMH